MKRCRFSACRKPFEPKYSTLQTTCSPECAIGYARESTPQRLMADRNKARAVELRERRVVKRKWRQENATIPQLIAKAQDEFNRFIRERDFGQPCICCGNYADGYDAGHYRSRGAAPQLRFNEDNCNLQAKNCNMGKASAGSNYRARLIDKIGLARVEALENSNDPHKWTREELIAIRRTYLSKWKELKAAREAKAA